MEKLVKREANYVPLSPVTFLSRAASAYAGRTSIIYGKKTRFTWDQTHHRCRRLAAALRPPSSSSSPLAGIVSRHDVVSVLAPNIPALYEMHFTVPMAGAVLNAINTRLDAAGVAAILAHSEAKLLFVDYGYAGLARHALDILGRTGRRPPLVVAIDDIDEPTGFGRFDGQVVATYEDLIVGGSESAPHYEVEDEWEPIALNYTSGTTSAPKGAVYSHRAAYLSTLSLLLQWQVGAEPVYLWSLPMFHCNGWTFTWGMAACGGANVCIRTASAAEIYGAIDDHGVTHMCCAPVVFSILLDDAGGRPERRLRRDVHVLAGGAPPPQALLEGIEEAGFWVTHAYGMTEATGPALVCEWRPEWDRLPASERARLKARQGVSVLSLAGIDVVKTVAGSSSSTESVARDGKMMGEIVLKGSSLMKGYYKNEEENDKAFGGGWFATGDVAVVHPDGYVEVKDRSKDVIISGGENISSTEVEDALLRHPAVAEAAVVAMPHAHWGEAPCAFVVLKQLLVNGDKVSDEAGAGVDDGVMVRHCRSRLPGFMVPRKVVFVDELPKTATGKIQKALLRECARRLMNNPAKTTTVAASRL